VSSPLGKKIKELRKSKKLSLDKLAVLTESSKAYLWELETKEDPNPSADKIARLAKALEVTTEYLMNPVETTPDQEVKDLAFFRKYKSLSDGDKVKLQKIIDAFD
jgi:transcriptional regulator with XRE-family HTH domain